MKGGIYAITSPSGNQYIGSAANFSVRWKKHRSDLRLGVHHSPSLQRAWNKYGEADIKFSKLLICDKPDLLFFEQRALDTLKPAYNVLKTAGSRLGMKNSEESKKNQSLRFSGNKNPMYGKRGALAPMFGFIHSEESKEKMAAARRGKPLSESHKASVSMSRMGRFNGGDNPNARPVICVELGLVFATGKLAIEWLRTGGKTRASQSAISAACIGKYKRAYGFHWKYV